MCNPILLYVAMAAICEEKYAYSATMKDTPSTRFPKTFTQQVKSYIRNFYELMMSDKISSVTVSGSYQLHKPLNCIPGFYIGTAYTVFAPSYGYSEGRNGICFGTIALQFFYPLLFIGAMHAEIKKLLLPKEICPAIHLYKLTELYVLAYLVGSSSYIITTDRQCGTQQPSTITRTSNVNDLNSLVYPSLSSGSHLLTKYHI
ncbi:hypothetical protein ABFX02_13G094200 [Erythranthe guttata]